MDHYGRMLKRRADAPIILTCLSLLLATYFLGGGQAEAASFPAGSHVEGHIGSHWSPCIVVGPQRATGGYALHCDELPDPTNIFSESDVRSLGTGNDKVVTPLSVEKPGRPVQGFFAGKWIDCTQLGSQLPTGGFRLHCAALPDPENVFSETDVRQIGAQQPTAVQKLPDAQAERRVQGHVGNHWEACTLIGAQLPTGGYLLRCDSTPADQTVFSASDVRF